MIHNPKETKKKTKETMTSSQPKGRSQLATTEQRPLRPQLADDDNDAHPRRHQQPDRHVAATNSANHQNTPRRLLPPRKQHDANNLWQAGNRPKSALYVRSESATEATRRPRKLNRVRRELQYPTSTTQLNSRELLSPNPSNVYTADHLLSLCEIGRLHVVLTHVQYQQNMAERSYFTHEP